MIFLDTGFLFALFVAGDEHHARVNDVFDAYRGRRLADLILTTNHVVAKTLNLLRVKGDRDPAERLRLAVDAGEQLFAGTFGRVQRTTEDEERAALGYMAKYEDHAYGFVDCLSFVVMERMGIREALAVDQHFTHRFVALPGPRPK